MKNLVRAMRLTVLGVWFVSPAGASTPPMPVFPALQFHPPKPERWVMDNGLVIFLLEDHELPLIRIDSIHRTGSQYESAGKVGIGQVFGAAMTLGGSAKHSAEEIEKTLDKTAASINFSVALESANGSMTTRADHFDTIFPLFADLLLHPQFRKDQVDLQKEKILEGLRRINDEPDDIARREFRGLVYGRAHPYARVPSPETVKGVKRQDLLDMHAHYFLPNASALAVSGDFKSEEMKRKLEQAFGTWAKGMVRLPEVPPVPKSTTPGVYYIQKPVNQSQIRTGGLGLERHNPDHFAWEVFNELWGGSASSLLFRIVRTQQGLAYSVGSAFSEPPQTGLIVAISQTRGPQTIAAVQSIRDITVKASKAPFSAEELKWAKESIRNRFVENFTSSAQIVSEIMSFEYLGFPKNYLDTYPDKIGAVTAVDVDRVGKTYLRPEQSKTLIVGDLSTFEKPISTLGKAQEVKPIDYSQEAPRP